MRITWVDPTWERFVYMFCMGTTLFGEAEEQLAMTGALR